MSHMTATLTVCVGARGRTFDRPYASRPARGAALAFFLVLWEICGALDQRRSLRGGQLPARDVGVSAGERVSEEHAALHAVSAPPHPPTLGSLPSQFAGTARILSEGIGVRLVGSVSEVGSVWAALPLARTRADGHAGAFGVNFHYEAQEMRLRASPSALPENAVHAGMHTLMVSLGVTASEDAYAGAHAGLAVSLHVPRLLVSGIDDEDAPAAGSLPGADGVCRTSAATVSLSSYASESFARTAVAAAMRDVSVLDKLCVGRALSEALRDGREVFVSVSMVPVGGTGPDSCPSDLDGKGTAACAVKVAQRFGLGVGLASTKLLGRLRPVDVPAGVLLPTAEHDAVAESVVVVELMDLQTGDFEVLPFLLRGVPRSDELGSRVVGVGATNDRVPRVQIVNALRVHTATEQLQVHTS